MTTYASTGMNQTARRKVYTQGRRALETAAEPDSCLKRDTCDTAPAHSRSAPGPFEEEPCPHILATSLIEFPWRNSLDSFAGSSILFASSWPSSMYVWSGWKWRAAPPCRPPCGAAQKTPAGTSSAFSGATWGAPLLFWAADARSQSWMCSPRCCLTAWVSWRLRWPSRAWPAFA